jgi:hypothetical protein
MGRLATVSRVGRREKRAVHILFFVTGLRDASPGQRDRD